MQETRLILKAMHQWQKNGQRAALATVVRTAGSTYRKAGAKMLISESGESVGSISAGCLESDVRKIALQVIKNKQPRLLRYDNTAREEIIWGLGLGCNGVVEVFVEPVD